MTQPRRPLRIVLIAVAAVVILGLGSVAVVIARFDPNKYKTDIVAAVKQATGRDIALNGQIGLKPSLWPTIQVADVTFSNPPGFSRPRMASLQRMEVQLALLPLLSSKIQISRLVLIHPDILLETDAAGHTNWRFAPETTPGVAPNAPKAPVQSAKAAPDISVGAIRIQDGTVSYRDDRTGKVSTLGLRSLDATAASPDAPVHLAADASYNGTPFNLAADTGSLNRLQDTAATTPWPVRLTLTVGTAKLSADGSLTRPLQGKGYALALNGTIPDAAALTPLLRGYIPPPLRDVSFAAKVADNGGLLPAISALTLHVGASDLGAQVPGLTLDHLDVAAPAADRPVKASAAGKLDGQPLTLAATSGPLALLMAGAKPAPFPIDATVQAVGATISAKGSIANPRALTGTNIALAAQIPDLSALSPLARTALPAIRGVVFAGTLTEAFGGFHNGAALHNLSLTSAAGDLSGDAAIGLGARTSLTARLKSNRIDLDALQAGAKPSASGASPPPSPPKDTRYLFSRQPVPFGLLRAADADVTLNIADLHTGGVDYKAIDGHAVLKDGRLAVSPFAADLPGGHLSATVAVDATQAAPLVHVGVHAPGLALKTLLAAVHEPSVATGNLEVYADLRGAGDSPHAIAASLDGSLGLAMAGGTIDNHLLGSLLGNVMNTLNALSLVGKGATSEVKCFGLRMDAQHGTGTFRALALSSSLLTMTGSGAANLGTEMLAVELRPQARVAGTGMVIPLNVTGPIRNPAVSVNKLGAAASNAGTVAGAIIGNATPLGIVGGLLGADKLAGGGAADICGPALAAARGQPVPAAAAKPPAPPKPGAPKPGASKPGASKPGLANPGALLKNLFR